LEIPLRKLGLIVALLATRFAFANDIVVDNFSGGLDTLDSPAAIQSNFAQDLLNVNIQPGGSAVYKRDGYALYQVLPGGNTQGVHGGFHFQQSGGNDVQIWGSSTTLYASVADASFVAIATGTLGATWQCADSQGNAYCFSSSNDSPVETDGTRANTFYVSSGVPLGTMATFTPLQLVVAGVSGNANTIYISGQLQFTNFAAGILPSSPFTEPIASPGSRITHLAYYFGRLFWWKDQSFGYATFTGQNDWQLTIVSNQIGTLDNSDAFWNSSGFDAGTMFSGTQQANANASPGGIYFRGQDNHLYVYDGYYLTRLSRIISPTVSSSSRRKANSWTITTASDFGTGSYSSTTYSTTFNGVVITTSNVNPTDNSFESNLWTQTTHGTFQRQTFVPGTSCGTINPKDGSWLMYSDSTIPMTVSLIDATSLAVYGTTTISLTSTSCVWTKRTITISSPPTPRTAVQLQITGQLSTNPADTVTSPVFAYSSTSTITFYSASDAGTNTAFDFFEGGATTVGSGIYYSAVKNAPNLTSWGNFTSNTSGSGGTQSFFVRSSTNTFSILSSTPSWVAQSNNSIVSASTGTFFQFSDTFTITSASQTPTLNNFTFNWYEGSASDKAYITYFNDAIWFSVSSSTSATTNNEILNWDLLNGAWLVYNISANGFLVENNTLYFADPSSPNIYRFGGVTTDSGTAINSYWRSKSFLYNETQTSSTGQTVTLPATDDLFVQKEFNQSDFLMGESSTTMTYTYTLDSKTATAYTFTAYDSAASLIQRNFLLPIGKIGKYYDFKIGDNSSAAAWRMFAHRVRYTPLMWKPQLN
jgi:hypothetical protein